jgi:hypothetical protein
MEIFFIILLISMIFADERANGIPPGMHTATAKNIGFILRKKSFL